MANNNNSSSASGCGCGGPGAVCGVILSAALNHSFWWGVLHFFLGWFYVLYCVLFRTKEILPALKAMFT